MTQLPTHSAGQHSCGSGIGKGSRKSLPLSPMFTAKHLIIYFLCSGLLLCCQRNQPDKVSTPLTALNERPLDSLTTTFLVHARDSVDTWSDSLVRHLAQALRQQGVDTTLYYRSGCSGCEVLHDKGATPCHCNTTELRSYLYWQYHGHTFVKQLDCCQNHQAMRTTSEAFDFYFRHRDVLAQGPQFYRDFQRYNHDHPDKPHFLPSGPIHDNVSYVHLTTGAHQLEVTVWAGEYDPKGKPLFLDYAWRRKQWDWTNHLDRLPVIASH
jgi:hypothetical protein